MRKIAQHKILSLIVLALVGLAVYRFIAGPAGGGPGGRGGSPPVYVELGEARFGTMREVGLYYGSLTAAQKFAVSPRVGGQLKTLFADIGDRIESGQLLAVLDDEEYRIARDQSAYNVGLAEAQEAEAQANLRLAQSDMNRQSSLADKRIVTQSDFETAENKLRQAEARLMVAESQLRGANSQLADAALKLSYTQISSTWPEGGPRFVAERMVDEGELLTANTPIFNIVSLDPLLVVVEVIEKDYPKIRIGQEAELRTEAWPGEVFKGRVVRVAPVLSAASRQARVELEVVNPDLRLKPGMFTEVIFIFKEVQNVWSVPQDVPFRRREGFVVFVADPAAKTVKMVPVSLGLVENGRVELVDAPAIDGPVVFLGQHLLEDGMNYRLPEAPKKPLKAGENETEDDSLKAAEYNQAAGPALKKNPAGGNRS
ncbi:efflux RND transporter periplasmic adaptor subunit [Deltaproteobacteria bacterium OttesenSCG-928-M10]|nr:efflux RND transporter periplasmic adaptor subunit [Deltaproteobacteria bacterium OttesenSCG-928-M10]